VTINFVWLILDNSLASGRTIFNPQLIQLLTYDNGTGLINQVNSTSSHINTTGRITA